MITVADEYFRGFLKIYVVSGAFKELLLVDDIIFPELDGLFFVLDCEENAMLVETLTWEVTLALEADNIVIEELTGYISIEFSEAEGTDG